MSEEKLSQEELQRAVYETKDAIVLNVRCEYVIEKCQINTAEKILKWIAHLSEKNWMSREVMRRFILLACYAAGIEPFGV